MDAVTLGCIAASGLVLLLLVGSALALGSRVHRTRRGVALGLNRMRQAADEVAETARRLWALATVARLGDAGRPTG